MSRAPITWRRETSGKLWPALFSLCWVPSASGRKIHQRRLPAPEQHKVCHLHPPVSVSVCVQGFRHSRRSSSHTSTPTHSHRQSPGTPSPPVPTPPPPLPFHTIVGLFWPSRRLLSSSGPGQFYYWLLSRSIRHTHIHRHTHLHTIRTLYKFPLSHFLFIFLSISK